MLLWVVLLSRRGTETTGPSFTADLATDLRSVQSPIQDMLGLPAGALDGATYQGMRVRLQQCWGRCQGWGGEGGQTSGRACAE